jgi:hypothetical protein
LSFEDVPFIYFYFFIPVSYSFGGFCRKQKYNYAVYLLCQTPCKNLYNKYAVYLFLEGKLVAVKSVSIRIEEAMLNKLSFVAEYEGRSINSHILVLIRESIKAHEKQYGKIEGQVTPDNNVKPPRKS